MIEEDPSHSFQSSLDKDLEYIEESINPLKFKIVLPTSCEVKISKDTPTKHSSTQASISNSDESSFQSEIDYLIGDYTSKQRIDKVLKFKHKMRTFKEKNSRSYNIKKKSNGRVRAARQKSRIKGRFVKAIPADDYFEMRLALAKEKKLKH